jgi:hypothetical protein
MIYDVPNHTSAESVLETADFYYPNYKPDETFVISGPLSVSGIKAGIPGRYFSTIDEAKEWVTETYGGFYEHIVKARPNRWAFRVKKGSHYNVNVGISECMRQTEGGGSVRFRVEI